MRETQKTEREIPQRGEEQAKETERRDEKREMVV
jgi:hypothetical protein